ncbi:HemK methyltransferase [Hamiltosporidium magnivora]|uniref:HemK methyltransferase n=1 Tax=Hamiltosporidium magnivora TaxID=148818 RepID=A0A4V2JVA5_9MICR|nr:HemK methyltransferase [Hamiltosporidium magnivora]
MKNKIYEPSEDTFSLIEALEKDINYLRKQKNPIFIEIGCGSNYISNFIKKTLNTFIISTDINTFALQSLTRKENITSFNLIRANLLTNIIQKNISILIFNPPYLETEEDEMNHYDIRASYAGGLKGRVIIDQFISQLSKINTIYLLVIKINKPSEIISKLEQKNYKCEIIYSKKCYNETYFVIKGIKIH